MHGSKGFNVMSCETSVSATHLNVIAVAQHAEVTSVLPDVQNP